MLEHLNIWIQIGLVVWAANHNSTIQSNNWIFIKVENDAWYNYTDTYTIVKSCISVSITHWFYLYFKISSTMSWSPFPKSLEATGQFVWALVLKCMAFPMNRLHISNPIEDFISYHHHTFYIQNINNEHVQAVIYIYVRVYNYIIGNVGFLTLHSFKQDFIQGTHWTHGQKFDNFPASVPQNGKLI